MKRLTKTLSMALIGIITMTGNAYAEGHSITFQIGKSWYVVNGTEKQMDSAAVIYNSRTMVPMKYAAEAMGADVNWDANTKSITIRSNGNTIRTTVGTTSLFLDQSEISMDTPVTVIDGRTMLPLSYAAQALGLQSSWDASTKTITLTDQVFSQKKEGVSVIFVRPLTQNNNWIRIENTPAEGYERLEVLYGKHAYGSNTQKEYSALLDMAFDAKKRLEEDTAKNGGWTGRQLVLDYQQGKLTPQRMAEVEKSLHREVLMADVDTVYRVLLANRLVRMIAPQETLELPENVSPFSAAARAIYGNGNNHSDSYIHSLAFDVYGFNTRIRSNQTKMFAQYEVNGKWYNAETLSRSSEDDQPVSTVDYQTYDN